MAFILPFIKISNNFSLLNITEHWADISLEVSVITNTIFFRIKMIGFDPITLYAKDEFPHIYIILCAFCEFFFVVTQSVPQDSSFNPNNSFGIFYCCSETLPGLHVYARLLFLGPQCS